MLESAVGDDAPMERFDLQPHLVGELVKMRPLQPEDWEELFAVAADRLIWELHPACDRYKEEVFREYFREGLEGPRRSSVRRATSGTDLIKANLRSAGRFWPGPIGAEFTTGR